MDNFREVNYGYLKSGLLYRGKALINLSNEDIALLKSHIKTVVDLRAPEEIDEDPDMVIEGINNISIPLFNANKTEPKAVNVKGMTLPDMVAIYRELVAKDKKDSWSKIFDLLLNSDGGIMFHCTSGKDRTGVTTAIILSALGIDKEVIYQDYLLTNKQSAPDVGFLKFAETLPPEVRDAFINHFQANKEYLEAIYDEIDQKYGSLNNFFKECCNLDENKLKQLKNKYLL